MNDHFMDFLTISLPTYFFFYMAMTLFLRNKRSAINRAAGCLMLAFLFYFLAEYVKTSLLPQYQMQIVLYGSAPMLLFIICFLVHLCILMGSPVTASLKRGLPLIYATPFALWLGFMTLQDHRVLYNADVTDGRSPLDPLFLSLTLAFLIGYILFSVVILAVSWRRTREERQRSVLRSLLLSMFGLFAWFVLVTGLLQSTVLTTRYAMIYYFIGYLVWAVALRRLIGKYDIMPDYRKLFHTVFESAPTAILLLDRKGRIREMNPRAKRWFEGIPDRELPDCFRFEDGRGLGELLDGKPEEREPAAPREVRLRHPGRGDSDWMMGLDVIESANEELFVMHLTEVTFLKDIERKLKESEGRYKHLAHRDPLTDLYNRAAVQERLQEKIAEGDRFALALVDIDHFKPVNDTYGHLVGDLYLKHIAQLLQSFSQPGDLVGRIGGDEFVLIVPLTDEADDVYGRVEERLASLQAGSFSQDGIDIPVSFSAGISVYPRDASDVTTLLKNADEAMYRVKRSGRSGIAVYAG